MKRTRRRGYAVVASIAALAVGCVVTWSILGTHSAGAGVTQTIYLDPPYDTEQFVPPPPGVAPGLTSSQAIAAFQQVVPGFVLPSAATVELGVYTAGTGDGVTYRFQNQLAWGISWDQCDNTEFQHPVGPNTVVSCTRWLFLDANTGQMLESVWQQPTPSGTAYRPRPARAAPLT